MPNSVTIDTSEFDQSLVQYAAASDRSFEEVCNKQARNLALRTVQFMPKASVARIRAVQRMDFWKPLIAHLLTKQGFQTPPRNRKKKFKTDRRKTGPWAKEARKLSRRMLRSRSRSVSFMKSGFAKAGAKFPAGQAGSRSPKFKSNLTKSRAMTQKAHPAALVAAMLVEYDTTKQGGDKRRKEQIAMRALNKALSFVAKDMQKYTERKLAQIARSVSVN